MLCFLQTYLSNFITKILMITQSDLLFFLFSLPIRSSIPTNYTYQHLTQNNFSYLNITYNKCIIYHWSIRVNWIKFFTSGTFLFSSFPVGFWSHLNLFFSYITFTSFRPIISLFDNLRNYSIQVCPYSTFLTLLGPVIYF